MENIMSKRILILITSIVLLWAGLGVAHSSTLHFRHFTDMNGLSSNTVRCIYQDNLGYIWAGTNSGLNRFNSYHFTTFYSTGHTSTSLGNNNIYSITDETPESRNRIWIGTVDGIYIFDNATQHFSKLPIIIKGKELHNTLIFSMTPDYDGNMWIATLGQGLLRYNIATESFTQYDKVSHPRIFERNTVAKIIIDADKNVWVGTGDGYICRYNVEQDNLTPFKVEDSITREPISRISSIYEDLVGNIWVAGLSGDLFLFDRSNNRFTRNIPDFTCNRIRSIIERVPGVLLLGTNQGLVSFDIRERRFEMVDNGRSGNDYGLKDNFIYTIEKDSDGGLWVGTYYGGISYLSSNNDIFFSPKIPENCGHIISCFCEDEKGNIWIGTDDNGLNIYNPTTQEYKPWSKDRTIRNLNIHSLLIHDNYLWIGTIINGLYRLDRKSGHLKRIYLDDAEGEDLDIYSLYCDSHGTLWVGTAHNICRYNSATQKIEKVFTTSYNSRVSSICEDAFENVWFATNGNGLLRYTYNEQRIEHFSKNEDLNLHPFINTLSSDGDKIWIGTSGHGLLRYDITNNRLTRVFEDTNYSFSSIFKIIPSGNELWVTTNNGLINYRYTQQEKTIVRYASDDGMSTNIFNLNAGIKSSTGYIYVGYNNGFDRFYPYDLKQHIQHRHIDVVISNLNLAGVSANTKQTYNTIPEQSMTIRTNKLSLSMSFIALNYSSPQRTIYRYRLNEFDKDWIQTDSYIHSGEHKVSYTNLPPDTYIFQVCASRNGEDFGEITQFEIKVLPPWWMTKAMISIYILLSIALIFAGVYYTRLHIDKQHRKYVEQLMQRKDHEILKTKFNRFTDLVSEFYMPLSLIIAPADKIAQQEGLSDDVRKDIDMIQRNSNKLLRLVDSISDTNESKNANSFTPKETDNENIVGGGEIYDQDILIQSLPSLKEFDGQKLSMLLVDNNAEFNDFCTRFFSSQFTVESLNNGNDALTRITNQRFDIILLDWQIEDLSCIELCKTIRQDNLIDDTPIIVLTNNSSPLIKSCALAAGADFCLDKWISPDFALRQINSIIKSREYLRIKYSKSPYISTGKDDQTIIENRFMAQVNSYVMDNIANTSITAEDMASAVNMSRTLFFSRIKQVTGLTPNEFLRTTRLKKAAELLAGDNKLRVTEICYMVGFSSTSYFAKCFQAQYGTLPNQYMEQHRS